MSDQPAQHIHNTASNQGVQGVFHAPVTINQNHHPSPPPAFRAPHPPVDFVARPHEFEQLLASLLAPQQQGPVALTTSLTGAGGYGKTTLAQALCHDKRVRAAFPDGILWVELGERPANLLGTLNGLAHRLTGVNPSFNDLTTAAEHLASVLADKRVLLVLDDVWEQAHLRLFLHGGPCCACLVTTRNRGTLPPNTRQVDVDAMRQSEAVALLRIGLPDADTHRAPLHALARRLGAWALLLRLANGFLRKRVRLGEPLAAALESIHTRLEKRGLVAFDARDTQRRDEAVAKTLQVSLELLSPGEQVRYAELAIFPEDTGIPLATVARLWQTSAGYDAIDTEDLCERLSDLSLLLRLDLGSRTIRLHDVVRSYLQQTHKDELARWHATLLAAHRPASGRWADLPATEPYLWQHLATHLVAAGWSAELTTLLLDFPWLQAKLEATDIVALLDDYDGLQPLPTAHTHVRDALRLAAHVLAEDRTQLAAQLSGRLLTCDDPAITALLAQTATWHGAPWLRPLQACLSPPGGPLIRTLRGHTHAINGCALSADGDLALSASYDQTVRLWDTTSGACLHTLTGHTSEILSCALSADGTLALSASRDQTLKLWDTTNGACLHTLTGHTSVVTSCALSADGRLALSAAADKTLRLWDTATGGCIHTLSDHTDGVSGYALSADGRLALSASDDTLQVWDTTSGVLIRTLTGQSGQVTSCALSADGGLALSTTHDRTLYLWDTATGALHHILTDHIESAWRGALSADGRRALSASRDHTLKLWDTATGALIHTLHGHTDVVQGCALSADGTLALSAAYDKTLKLWDTTSWQERPILRGHTRAVHRCALSTDGRLALSASLDGMLKLWDSASGALIHTLTDHMSLVQDCALSADGRLALSVSDDQTLKVWDTASGALIHTLTDHMSLVQDCALSADGRLALSVSDDQTLKVWNTASGALIHTLTDHMSLVQDCALSADGRLALSASWDQTLKLWDTHTGACLHRLTGHTHWVNDCALSADGRLALSAAWDETLKLWDTTNGVLIRTLRGHRGAVWDCALSADGRLALSASYDQTLRLWDTASGALLVTFHGEWSFDCCALSADGRAVMAGDRAGIVHFLRVEGL